MKVALAAVKALWTVACIIGIALMLVVALDIAEVIL